MKHKNSIHGWSYRPVYFRVPVSDRAGLWVTDLWLWGQCSGPGANRCPLLGVSLHWHGVHALAGSRCAG